MARKEKNIHYIYKTTCNVTGRWYIGMHSTHNLDDGYMGSGLRLRRSIRKYGVDNHTKEILEYSNSREDLVLREIAIVNEDLLLDDLCMNLKCGGTGGFSSEEHMMKCSKAGNDALKHKLKNDNELLNKFSKIASDNLRKAHSSGKIKYKTRYGVTTSDETKEKISNSKKGTGVGELNSQYGTKWAWIHKDGEVKKIKKENLDNYLNNGWLQGRK